MKNILLAILLLLSGIASAQKNSLGKGTGSSDGKSYNFFSNLFGIDELFSTKSESTSKHEISIYGTSGLSALQYQSAQGKVGLGVGLVEMGAIGVGAGGGVGYTLFFASHWGFSTGVEARVFDASVSGDEIRGSKREVYDYGRIEDAYFNSIYDHYKETQRAMYLHVPLMLQFQTATKHKFYAAAGAKAGVALSGTYETTANSLVLSGYFPSTKQNFENVIEVGYLTKEQPTASGNLDFGLNLSLSAEIGVCWSLGKSYSRQLYTGLYVDYGMLNVAPKKTTTALVSRPNNDLTTFSYNSLLTATLPTGTYVDKINLFAAGLKIKLAFCP